MSSFFCQIAFLNGVEKLFEGIKAILQGIGIIRAIIAILSVGIAHNLAFMLPIPNKYWALIDSTFLIGISLHYMFVLSSVLVFSVVFMHLISIFGGVRLVDTIDKLERRHENRLGNPVLRDRYINLVGNKITNKIRGIAYPASWIVATAIFGYLYAGLAAFLALPVLVLSYVFAIPILYPHVILGYDALVGAFDETIESKASILTASLADLTTLRQITAFLVSLLILASLLLGLLRHQHQIQASEFMFFHNEKVSKLSFIGSTSNAIIGYDRTSAEYSMIFLGSLQEIKATNLLADQE